ncbi:MAG TPA: BMP family ABC transporter substrate-binding protein [Ilumatobacteraceae bacterium]|nr:BMP family ABC transporter substrate-binding protein [Ilumatobacteraceae bacterium]HRB02324.1 BMP family ABC transporter substrate-binding protein [Ilumatobacteraceae bacterium]
MRNTKRVAAMAFIATFGLIAAACSDDKATTDTTKAPAESTANSVAPSDLKVGVAFDTGGRGDGTFNDSAGRGADKAKSELGATVQEIEATVEDDRKPNLEALTAAGNNPVIVVGFSFGDSLAAVAAANPGTVYGWVDGYQEAPNVKVLSFAANEGSFLVGAAAALKCGCDKIGFIGGQEIDLIKEFEAGYAAGAKAVNPKIEVKSQYLGAAGDNAAWGSPDKAKEIALGWFADGVEVIYSAAGGSGNGTIDAAVQADKWAIGVDSDQYLTATPEQQKHILTSMLKRVDVAVFETIKAVQGGDIAGGFNVFDLSVDGVGYSTSGGYLDEFKTQLDDLKAKVVSGEIVVPKKP